MGDTKKDEPVTWADVLDRRKPRTSSVTICMDNDVVEQIVRLDQQLREAAVTDSLADNGRTELAERIEALREQAKASEVTVRFQEIGQGPWNRLLAACTPTDAQKERGMHYNPETFTPKVLAASIVEPTGITEEVATRICEEWSEGTVQALWQGCLEANQAADVVPFSLAASAQIKRLEAKSDTPVSEESLSQS